jgi:hypothetical protein
MVVTIANMGEGVAIAEALAASAAAATAATTAAETAAATEAAAAQQAGQAGIMSGSAVPPPGVTPPGAPGLGAPMPPAQPLPPAVPPALATPLEPAGINPITPAGDVTAAQTLESVNAANPAIDPTKVNPFQPNPTAEFSLSAGQNAVPQITSSAPAVETTAKPLFGDNALGRGIDQAMKLVSDTAQSAYKTYREAPPALQYLSAGVAAKKYLMEEPQGAPKDNYKRTPYSGLSPNFVAGGPSPYLYGANGGIMSSYADGGPVEQMSNMNAIGGNEMYPMANIPRLEYANPVQQRPVSENIMTMGGDAPTDPYTGQLKFNEGGYAEEKEAAEQAAQRKRYFQMMGNTSSDVETDIARGQAIAAKARGSSVGIIPRSRAQSLSSPNSAAQAEMAAMMKKYGIKATMPKTLDPQSGNAGAGESDYAGGGVAYGLGGYSDGGRLLRGPGDGVSDSIPATIGSKQPARLADGEFVIPARIVSELGNGSTEAGARQLYAMMERIQKNRKKSVGKGKVAVNSKAAKHLPA